MSETGKRAVHGWVEGGGAAVVEVVVDRGVEEGGRGGRWGGWMIFGGLSARAVGDGFGGRGSQCMICS